MAFGVGKNIAVLESKLDIYEDLSQQMLEKLERAVGEISSNSNKIAIILERHENRLDGMESSDQLIIKMIEEVKENNSKDNEILHKRVTALQKKVNINGKFVIGATAVLTTLVTVLQIVSPIIRNSNFLTPKTSSASIQRLVV